MKKRFLVKIAFDECKGCGRCVLACQRGVLTMGKHLNIMSYPAVELTGKDCVGCGICFYTCPEPGALTIVEESYESEQ